MEAKAIWPRRWKNVANVLNFFFLGVPFAKVEFVTRYLDLQNVVFEKQLTFSNHEPMSSYAMLMFIIFL